MKHGHDDQLNIWEKFYGPNLGYIHQLFEQYRDNPDSVDESLKEMFEEWGPPPTDHEKATPTSGTAHISKIVSTIQLIDKIRTYGHLDADIYPLHDESKGVHFFDIKNNQLTEEDLKEIPVKALWESAPSHIENALEAIQFLKKVYTKSLAFEFSHIHEKEEKNWLDEQVETEQIPGLSDEEKRNVLLRLTEVEEFEKFLHKTFVGQKRFSIEGLDMLVPMLDEFVRSGSANGVENIMISMAHRGRLNVLAHTLGKPYEKILAEFHHSPNKELIPSEGSKGINYGWTGDVKYHLGADRDIETDEKGPTRVTLANNPSHLEFVNPIVEGYTRAAQDDRTNSGYPKQDTQKSFSIIIHGDAAFPGEGVVQETLNLSRLKGYQTGGTIHIIANNTIGFTTESEESRSTKYASDLAKGFEIPIIHVNADDPESCMKAVKLAYEYRSKFKKDILIDLIGYRRFGHNEMDDPAATQPELYRKINDHPTVLKQFSNRLIKEEVLTEEQCEEMKKKVLDSLKKEYENLSTQEVKKDAIVEVSTPISERLPKVKTAISLDELKKINKSLLDWPDDITVYPKLAKILKRREKAFEEDKIDWALAETLAFATILADGKPIRLTGQDSERGTFAHRHIVLHDQNSKRSFSPLHTIPQARASFAIHNSPLTEIAVLGFEYGYNVYAPETLVLWEAQFGDFVNAAQVIIDQFISAGRAKWGQKSSLVMLLPHGYEGQGPEHSSGRLERFLQLAAENNCTVANMTSAAQYFHILRRQAAITEMPEARPLIIMTPKSLLRNTRVFSSGKELSEGEFQPLIDQQGMGKKDKKVKRLLLCSGKISIDLAAKLEEMEGEKLDWLHITRVEQLYPFPKKELEEKISQFKNLKEVVWIQEEPQNMGAWSFVQPRIQDILNNEIDLRYIGRTYRSSPATGEPNIHKKEQERIVTDAITINDGWESE